MSEIQLPILILNEDLRWPRRRVVLNRRVTDREIGEALSSLYGGSFDDATDNVFCATGKGGGIDPTCSPRGGGPKGPHDQGPGAGWTPGAEPLQTPGNSMGTMGKYFRNGEWDPSRKPIHDAILDDFRKNVVDQERDKTLYMTGGGFGSGKSTLLEKFPRFVGFPDKTQAAIADPDAAKKLIPEMAQRIKMGDHGAASYVHEESSEVAKRAVTDELGLGHSVVYDTSGDSGVDKLARKVEGFRKDGAVKVVAHYATPLSVDEAHRRTVDRARRQPEGQRRELTRTQVEGNHREVSRCWQALAKRGVFDELGLWSTAGKFGDPPVKIAEAKGGKITVHDRAAYEKFVKIGE